MNSFDVFSMGIRSLFKRKLRTFLTVLGVVIGAASIIIMISLGIAVNVSFEEQIKNWGDLTIIQIENWDGYNGQNPSAPLLDDKMMAKIKALENCVTATPVVYVDYQFVSGKYLSNVPIRAISAESMPLLGYTIKDGDFPDNESSVFSIAVTEQSLLNFRTEREIKAQNNSYGNYGYSVSYSGGMMMSDKGGVYGAVQEEVPVAKVDMNDKYTMSYYYNYGFKPQKGEEAPNKKPDSYKINISGILGESDDPERSYYCIMPLEQVLKIKKDEAKWQKAMGNRNQQETYGYERAIVKVNDINNSKKLVEDIKALGFANVFSSTEGIDYMKEISNSLQGLLAAIGSVSLIVAAIGISNTMIMSIYERTKEIGVMKVIGAKLSDIGKLFLFEAACIGFLGGIFGVGLSYLGSYILNNIGGIPFLNIMSYSQGAKVSIIPLWLAGVGIAFSVVIGLASGLLPAIRAMRISAITAIRNE